MQSRQKEEHGKGGREKELPLNLQPRRRQVVAIMERRRVSRGEESKRIPLWKRE